MMYKIGELAEKTGCRVVTIRYYEKEGLLRKPERGENNYRLYHSADVERLAFIMHCRRHAIRLDDIKALLAYRDRPFRNCRWVGDILDSHIRHVGKQIQSLKKLEKTLKNLRRKCAGKTAGASCGIIASLTHPARCGCDP